MNPLKILVLCTGNSCRSQMAEGYLRYYAGERAIITSAGLEVHGVNPGAIATMKKDGIDISNHTSNHLNEFRHNNFDYIITVCDHAKESCPFFPGNAIRIHQNFPDPAKASGTKEEIAEEFRKTRDLIKKFTKDFIEQYID